MVWKIEWTKRALNDLHDIYDFIAKDSERYAQMQLENIQNAVSRLTDFPLMGREVPEFPHLTYREILVGNYRVFYRLEAGCNRILLMSVVHGRRLLKNLR